MIILGPDQERYGRLIETPSLPIPLLNRVEGALPGQIEHEKDSHGVIADKGQHVDEFSLSAKIPYGECYFSVPY